MPVANIYPSKGCTVDQGQPNTNVYNGYINIGYGYPLGTGVLYSWLSFNLSTLPNSISVTSVVLFITVQYVRGYDYNGSDFFVYKAASNTSWSQSTITWNNAPNGYLNVTESGGMYMDAIDIGNTPTPPYDFNVISISLTASDISDSRSSGEITYRISNDSLISIGGSVSNYYLTINYTEIGITLPTSDIDTNSISGTLLLSTPVTFQQICQAAIVQQDGLNNTYCPGANAAARLTNLQSSPYEIAKLRGYAHSFNRPRCGYLYNWFAVGTGNLAPTGWRVPTKTDFDTLSTTLGGDAVGGGKLKVTGYTNWISPNTGADNSANFNGVSTGRHAYINTPPIYVLMGLLTYFWTTTQFSGSYYYYRRLNSVDSIFYSANAMNTFGLSVRCIKNDSTNPGTVTDYDGNVYDCVTIGTQVWMKQNLKVTTYNNGTSIPNVTNPATWAGLSTGARCAYNDNEYYV